jgi:hypothetical protein
MIRIFLGCKLAISRLVRAIKLFATATGSSCIGQGDCGPGDCDLPVFERLAQKIEHVSPKLREFIQEEDPLWARLTSPGFGMWPPPTSPASDMV